MHHQSLLLSVGLVVLLVTSNSTATNAGSLIPGDETSRAKASVADAVQQPTAGQGGGAAPLAFDAAASSSAPESRPDVGAAESVEPTELEVVAMAIAEAAQELNGRLALIFFGSTEEGEVGVGVEPGEVAIAEAEAKPEKPSNKRKMKLVKTITGRLSPKSIVADQNGQIFAMNMMYNHTITVFDNKYKRVKVIPDTINLSKFGFKQYPKRVRGAPVEAALSPDGKKMYVSNYTMYGPGFPNQGFDLCVPGDRIDRGFVYEIDTETLRKTDAIQVGEVPKYLAITPNGRYMLVGNWCSYDFSVVDLKKGKEIKRIKAGVGPRGIAFSPNGKTAYVTLVGEHRLLVIDMKTFRVKRTINGIGQRPRHLVMSPGGRYLYITIQGEDKPGRGDGRILKYDTKKRKVVARSKALDEPRTTVLSDDGKSLYVVDYHPGTVVKLDARNLKRLQTEYLGYHPIGVTYDNDTNKVWVSGYGGSVWVLKDR